MYTYHVFGYTKGGLRTGNTFSFTTLKGLRQKIEDNDFTFEMVFVRDQNTERRLQRSAYYVKGEHPTLKQMLAAHPLPL